MNFNIDKANAIYKEELEKYNQYKKANLNLDMSRGKPNAAQLDLSNEMFNVFDSKSKIIGIQDYRNYGILDGIPEAKKMFSELSGVSEQEIFIMGNSSLNIMYDTVQRAMQFGVLGGVPFNKQNEIKWLCPVPGYDRHFSVTEIFGIKMINIPMLETGPDMEIVEEYIKDETVKGIWCVPKYSNPQGLVYSDETVERLAKMKPAAQDFRIYWDNAYIIHYITEDVPLKNIFETAKKYGNEDIVYMFGSTSKITFPGAGVAWMCASEKNITDIKKHVTVQTIGHDKINQILHVKFFKDVNGINEHMKKHAEILKPKFQIVIDIFEKELTGLCHWDRPKGGYFISCDLPEFTAKRAVELAKNVGVIMTDAGATFPYKFDPKDSNVRIAPSFPTSKELELGMHVFCCCVKLAWAEKVLNA